MTPHCYIYENVRQKSNLPTLGSSLWTDIARSIGGGAVVVPIGTLSEVSDTGTGQRNATVTALTEVFPEGRGFLRIKISE